MTVMDGFEIDPELVTRYLQRRRQDLAVMVAALASRDFATLENFGHQWKGNADSFGFSPLAEMAQRLEQAAIEGDTQQLNQLFAEIQHYISGQLEKTS